MWVSLSHSLTHSLTRGKLQCRGDTVKDAGIPPLKPLVVRSEVKVTRCACARVSFARTEKETGKWNCLCFLLCLYFTNVWWKGILPGKWGWLVCVCLCPISGLPPCQLSQHRPANASSQSWKGGCEISLSTVDTQILVACVLCSLKDLLCIETNRTDVHISKPQKDCSLNLKILLGICFLFVLPLLSLNIALLWAFRWGMCDRSLCLAVAEETDRASIYLWAEIEGSCCTCTHTQLHTLLSFQTGCKMPSELWGTDRSHLQESETQTTDIWQRKTFTHFTSLFFKTNYSGSRATGFLWPRPLD